MTFRRVTVWERLVMVFMPARRREYESELYQAMKWIVEHPFEDVYVEGK